MFEEFYGNQVIMRLAGERRWTIVNDKKVPLDITDLLESRGRFVHGAMSKEYHCPYVTLSALMKNVPDASNNTYWLDAKTDKILVLDIEPKCPKEIATELLKLPYLYAEYSMSGKGYHLILPLPNTYEDVYACKPAAKEEHGYYEFLTNHHITFTRNVLPYNLVPGMCTKSYDDFVAVWNEVAKNIKVVDKNVTLEIMSEEIETDFTEEIQEIMTSDAKRYYKDPSDFDDDMSRYEYGCTSHYYYQLVKLLKEMRVKYEKDELIWELYRTISEMIPYREKHDTSRNGMPWLLYTGSLIVEQNYDSYAEEIAEILNSDDSESKQVEDDDEEDEDEYFYEENASEYNCEYNII